MPIIDTLINPAALAVMILAIFPSNKPLPLPEDEQGTKSVTGPNINYWGQEIKAIDKNSNQK